MTPLTNQTRINPLVWWSYRILLAGVLPLYVNAASSSPFDIDAGGNLKSIISYQRQRSTGVFQKKDALVTEQRLRLRGVIARGGFRAEVQDEVSFFYQTRNPTLISVPDFSPQNWWNATTIAVGNSSTKLVQRIDRAFVQYNHENLEFIVGKQVVSTGVGHLFSAVSQVPRWPFVVVDPEYPVTEDSVTAIWKGPLVLEARFLPRVESQRQHNFHVRAKGSKGGYDVALTAGRSDDKAYLGLETAGNIGDSLIRAELVGYQSGSNDFAQALVGFDTVLSAKWSFEAEAFYHGFGKRPGNYLLEPLPHRPAPYRGQWYLAAHAGWDPTPRLKAQLLAICNLLDPSVLWHLWATYSLASNLDLTVGQFLGVGSRVDSEFGGRISGPPGLSLGLPDLSYVLVKWSF